MSARWMTGCLVAVCLVWLGVGGAYAAEGKGTKPVLPQAAQDAVLKAFPGAILGDAEGESEGGVKFFSVELKQDGKTLDVEVTAEGLLGEIESVVKTDSLPAGVQKALQEATKGGKITSIEKHEIRGQVKDGKFVALATARTVFEAKYTLEGKRLAVEVSVDKAGAVTTKKLGKGEADDGEENDD